MKSSWLFIGLVCLSGMFVSVDAKPARYNIKSIYLSPANCQYKECGDKKKHGNIHVLYTNGKNVQVTKSGNCVGNLREPYDPKISPDHRTAGWVQGEHIVKKTVNMYSDGRQVPGLNVWHGGRQLVLYRNGKVLSRIRGQLYFVEDWYFWDQGKQVAFTSRQAHGPGVCELHDAVTGRLISKYSSPRTPKAQWPAWAAKLNG